MATEFDTWFSDSGLSGLLDNFGESVTYYPYRYAGSALRANRTIVAIINREQLQSVSQDGGQAVLPVWTISVRDDSTSGISSSELDLGGDQIGFPPRNGQTAERRSIVKLISQDSGALVLECR